MTIADLKLNLKNYKEALVSNKDDTSYIIGLLAKAQEELNNIQVYVAKLENDKRHLKNVRITSAALAGTGVGAIILANTVPMEKQYKDFLNGFGIGTAAAGALSFGISFIF